MKNSLLALPAALLIIFATSASAQQAKPDNFLPDRTATGDTRAVMVKYTLLLPDDKTSELVKPEERNPFGKGQDEMKNLNARGSNEENVIRARLEKLRVVGRSPGPNGLRIMLGDMMLECGQEVPPLIPEQTLKLRVGAISPQAIELVWVEKKASSLPPRKLVIPVELRPSVRYLLQGQEGKSTLGEKATIAKLSKHAVGTQILDAAARTAGESQPQTAAPTAVPAAEKATSANSASVPDANATRPSDFALSKPAPASLSKPAPAPAVPNANATPLSDLVSLKAPPAPPSQPAPVGVVPEAKATPPADIASSKPAVPPVEPDLAPAPEPPVWKAAVGFLNNLVKLKDANK